MSLKQDWVVLDANSQTIRCNHCLKEEPIKVPAPVTEFVSWLELFGKLHKDCPPFRRGDLIIPEGETFPGSAITFDRMEGGEMKVYPRGGGFEMTLPAGSLQKYKFRKVTDDEVRNVPLRKAKFHIDCWERTRFEGWTYGDRWNGWACPYFNFETTERIMKLLKKDGISTSYNAETDIFMISRDADEKEEYKGEEHTVDGKKLKLYPVGNGVWTWMELRKMRAS